MPATVDFAEVADSQGTTRGQAMLCGARTYEIKKSDDSAIDWVTVAAHASTASTYTISANPTLDSQYGTNSLKLVVKLALYPAISALEISFNVVINTPPCNCALVGWDAPAAQTLTTTKAKSVV